MDDQRMTSKDKMHIMLSFMKELDGGNIPSASDYNLEQSDFGAVVELCQNEGYITGAKFARGGRGNKIIISFLENVELTVKGMEYLKENSNLFKFYKGLKEIREWLPK